MDTLKTNARQGRLQRLYAEQGQSPWLDNIRRGLISSGDLRHMMDQGIRGVTANPAIFEKAITGSDDYDVALRALARDGADASTIYEALAVEDIQMAADVFRPLYEQSDGIDGRVSIEVSPRLAHDTAGTIAEARRLHQSVNRPNIFVKVPATEAGIPAIRQLLTDGIDINITLMFSTSIYDQVIDAYLDALEARVAREQPVSQLTSVASFFVSRVDTEVDKRLLRLLDEEHDYKRRRELQALLGTAAIANARIAYDRFQRAFRSDRFARLRAPGARVQRPLWASTGTKNPVYRDVRYVDELIGPDTVNTMPPATIGAFRNHGQVARTIDVHPECAYETLRRLESTGISMADVTDKLLTDGIQQFSEAFDRLEAAIARKSGALAAPSRIG